MPTPKKTSAIELRISDEDKAGFAARCQAEGRSMSEALRRFIAEPPPAPVAPPRPAGWRLLVAGLVGALLGLGAAAPSFAHAATAQPGFAALDRNHDGVLTPAEFARR